MLAEVLAGADTAADEAGADDGGVLTEVEADADAVAVGEVVGEVVGDVDVVGGEDVVGVGVGDGVALAVWGGGVYAGALDEVLCDGDGDGDALLGALEDGAGAEEVTAAGRSLSGVGECLVAAVTTKTAAPTAPSITPMMSASMSGRTRRRRGWFPPPAGPYGPVGGGA